MCTGAYKAASCIDHMTVPHISQVGLEGPGSLCKLAEHLMAHVWSWNPEVPALGVARHFAKVLEDGNDNISPFCLL